MAKKNARTAEKTEQELLREAKEIESRKYKQAVEGFLAEYNKLVDKYGVQLTCVPKMVPAGNGMFGLGAELAVQPKPQPENGQ